MYNVIFPNVSVFTVFRRDNQNLRTELKEAKLRSSPNLKFTGLTQDLVQLSKALQ